MKIVHVCQPTDGGAAVVALALATAAGAAGLDVTLVSPAGGFLARDARDQGVRWVELPMGRAPAAADVGLTGRLRALLAGADVAHLHSSKAGALGRLAVSTLPARRRPRVVFTPHGWSWYVGGRLAFVYRTLERVLASTTDVITAVSATELADGRAALGARAPLELVANGVDVTRFTPEGPVAGRTSSPLVVQVGRLSVQKGQDRAVRALARLTNRTVRLRLVGDGPCRAELVRLADELGVGDRMELVGTQDPRPHLRAADLVILPSRWEGMPLALLEAMATGSAIVATDCGGSEALGETGRRISNADDEAAVAGLVGAFEELIPDPQARRSLGRAARLRAETDYAWSSTLTRHQEVWHRAPQRRRRSSGGSVTSSERSRVPLDWPSADVLLTHQVSGAADR